MVARDRARALQPLHALGDRRRRQADLVRARRVRGARPREALREFVGWFRPGDWLRRFWRLLVRALRGNCPQLRRLSIPLCHAGDDVGVALAETKLDLRRALAHARDGAAPALLRRKRRLPLPRSRVRGAPLRPARTARSRMAPDRECRRDLRTLATTVARAPIDPRDRRSSHSSVVFAAMNVCFYVAIDRLPLGTVAAIEFVPVIALAALGARTRRNASRSGSRSSASPAHRRAARGRARRASPLPSRTPCCSRSTSCSRTDSRGARRSADSTVSRPRCSWLRSS